MALQKSQTAGIDVDCYSRRNWWEPEVAHDTQPFLDGLRPHVTRVRSLMIKEKDLESLIVGISTSSQLGALPTSKTNKAADPTKLALILAEGTPMLRTIHLYRCSLTWPSLGLTNLKSITLDRVLGHLYKSQFLSILAASPALEHFCFTGTVLPDPNGVQPSSVRLDLLKTFELSLDDDSPEPFDLLNSIAATPAKSFTFNFSAEKGGVLGPNIGDIWTFAKGIAETETRLFLGTDEERSWFAIGHGKGQFSVSAEEDTDETDEENRTRRVALFEAILKQIPSTWLLSVGEAELEIDNDNDWVLHDLLLSLNDHCPNIAHFSLPNWNNTWESLLSRPEVGSAWKFPRLSSIHFFDSYDGGLVETAKDRKQAADAGEIITGLRKLVAIVDTDGYIEDVEPEGEELEELGLVDRQYINKYENDYFARDRHQAGF